MSLRSFAALVLPFLALFSLLACAQVPAQSAATPTAAAGAPGQNDGAAPTDYPPPKPLAVIMQTGVFYYSLPAGQFLGQMNANDPACISGRVYTAVSNGTQWFQYFMPDGLVVYSPVEKQIFSADPAHEQECLSRVAKIDLSESVEEIYSDSLSNQKEYERAQEDQENAQVAQYEAKQRVARAPLMLKPKEVGDTVCDADGDVVGQVDAISNARLRIIVEMHRNGFISISPWVPSTPAQNWQELDWIDANRVYTCN